MNELLFIATLLINFLGITLIHKFFGKAGVFAWIGFATVASNIEIAKCVDLFGMSVTLGNVIYATTFLATDILSEEYDGKTARQGVLIGFFTLIVFTLMSQTNLLYIPNEQDTVSSAMQLILGTMPRVCIASMSAYLVANILDTYIYDFIKKKAPKHKWLRNNAGTLISQMVDTLICTVIIFTGTMPFINVMELALTSYIIKGIVAICDTPFLYITTHKKKRD